MQKSLLLSVVIGMICTPLLVARERNAVRAVKKTVLVFFVIDLLYLLAVRFGYPQ